MSPTMGDTGTPLFEELGLLPSEYDRVVELMGREPTDPELVMFSLMWSEHCSYKHSKPLLKGFPTTGPRVVMGPGENAGAVDVGDGLAIVFKVESHNHPSAVEPFQGAATGVGGIVRDIIAVGAKPIALLDSLRFGTLDSARSRFLFRRAVEGIGHYGNCIGIPNVGGEVQFDDRYEDSCLVNAMCVGVVPHDQILSCAARGIGNRLVLIGNRTGRDGIGGASVLASAELGDDDADKRPSVQVGDPFPERKLMDLCQALNDADLLVALQDLGAAGLTSAAGEMASRGGVGLAIDLDRVPLREQGLAPGEVLVSESQERMLAIVEPAKMDAVVQMARRHELDATDIGEVTGTGELEALWRGEEVVRIPSLYLTDDVPFYDVPRDPAPAPAPIDLATVPEPDDLAAAWLALMADPNIASKRWVFQQYDQLVGANTMRRPGGDAGVVRIPGTGRAIAVTLDCAEWHTELQPYEGGMASVLEAARNVACTGAVPIAATDCLNYANPEKGGTGWRLAESIRGMADALIAIDAPIVSGNVSLYNESPRGPIYPTPVVGIVGLLDDASTSMGSAFAEDGDAVLLIGYGEPRVDASRYLGRCDGLPPAPEPATDAALLRLLAECARQRLLRGAHDVSEGGLAVAVAESAIAGGIGATVQVHAGRRADEALFGEGGGRVVASCDPANVRTITALATGGVTVTVIGTVGGDEVSVEAGGSTARVSLHDLAEVWEGSIPAALEAA
ncbi:MAG: phosphoribosylformylglycinamidine synthase subunit PurL [Actinomycetota bacterium]